MSFWFRWFTFPRFPLRVVQLEMHHRTSSCVRSGGLRGSSNHTVVHTCCHLSDSSSPEHEVAARTATVPQFPGSSSTLSAFGTGIELHGKGWWLLRTAILSISEAAGADTEFSPPLWGPACLYFLPLHVHILLLTSSPAHSRFQQQSWTQLLTENARAAPALG